MRTAISYLLPQGATQFPSTAFPPAPLSPQKATQLSLPALKSPFFQEGLPPLGSKHERRRNRTRRLVCRSIVEDKKKKAPEDRETTVLQRPHNKSVAPPTIGDRLNLTVTAVLNVVAVPAGLVALALMLPGVWGLRFWQRFTREPMDMVDKVVLVTGASSGIGEHMAYEYARLGAKLALVARREEKLQEVAEEARVMGSPEVVAFAVDLGNEAGCRNAVDSTVAHFGCLDVLVTNAGNFQSWLFEDAHETEGFRVQIDVNFWNHVYMTYYALPHLRKSRGQIVADASVSAIVPQPRNALYNAAKAAQTNFYHTLRIELGDAVPITVFSPGVTKSELSDGKVIKPDGYLPDWNEANKLRNEQLGLYPMMPTADVAREAVRAARYRVSDVTIPQWFDVLAIYRVVAPELLDNFLRFILVRDTPLAKQVIDTFHIKVGQPSRRDYEQGDIPAPGQPRRRG